MRYPLVQYLLMKKKKEDSRFRFRSWIALFLLLFMMLALLVPVSAADSPKDLLAAGRVDEALQTLQLKIDHSATDAESYNLLCRAYFMLEEWDRGIAACERARILDPQKSLYYLWLGRIYGEKADRAGFLSAAGLAKRVRTSFERAVELDPGSWEARTDLAEFYFDAPGIVGGGKDKARAQAEAVAPLNPGMAHWIRGQIAERSKDAASAEREYRAFITSSHSAVRAWVELAIFLRRHNRLDEMEDALRNGESAPVDQAESLMDGASILLRTGRDLPLAVRLLKHYLASPVERAPAFKAHDMLGQILEKQGDRSGAAEEYRAALALAHNYAHAREHLKRVQF
jgi:tetratricopeptide (TPR) repeat protein